MQIILASRRSPDAAPNDDFAAATATVAVVLDGAAAVPGSDTGCVHGTAWFVHRLGVSFVDLLARNADSSTPDNLAQAIVNVNALHAGCDMSSPGSPSAAVAAVRVKEETIEFLALGGTTIVLEEPSGVLVISGNRGGDDGTGKRRPTVSSTVRSDPSVANHAHIDTMSRRGLRRVVLLTDGASRLADQFGLMDWSGLLDLLEDGGPELLIEHVRKAERSDPDRLRWPRDQAYDHATVILCDLRDRAAGQA